MVRSGVISDMEMCQHKYDDVVQTTIVKSIVKQKYYKQV